MTDPRPEDRTDPPAADEDATDTSGAGYGNHPTGAEDEVKER